MGRIRVLAFSACLLLSGGAAMGQSGGDGESPAVDAGASRLLAAILGVPAPGALSLVSSSVHSAEEGAGGEPAGQVHRLLGMDGSLWMLVSSRGEDRSATGGYRAVGLEAWLGSEPVLSVADFRIEEASPDRIALASGKLQYRAGHQELRAAVSADRGEVAYDGAGGGTVALTGVEGTLTAPGVSAGGRMRWSAGRLEAEGGRIRLSGLAVQLGWDRTVDADLLEFGNGPGGRWMIRIDRLAVSRGLTGRFRALEGLGLPPVTVSVSFEPRSGGRWLYTVQIDAAPASFRIDGWVEAGRGAVVVREVEAQGLLGFLASAGSMDPLAAAARMGLFYGDAEQEADLVRGVRPAPRQAGN